ncbi:sugar ABC transporter ATP-binding protein [Mycetocola reblochoni]|uniref:Ribose ABC transport system, ATP-binding protein RbsA (TC 3.A.1.2.1) n=2 Tax=Mycetocola reblochoni TaxID=331618 RepID=A0A1R4IH81_9MICO|nr:sugar ABC transporter ATP-binding protein [Mycetocola reblochoni]RLP69687.1 sugar ABC transporter ATP-binding protein [Mycetocola reblochoni]SJN19151.1 Ribose ABC transport system, ATP-binding protein RbsA (TC 3.A.1.2.1) [Mycetocola reblochoni REB411]
MNATADASGLRIRGLRKAYGAVLALRELDLDVERGSIHGLLGGNGSGKSTLAKIISGAVVPDAGVITLDGVAVTASRPADALANGIVITYQELSLLPSLSVRDNLVLGRIPGGVFRSRAETIALTDDALAAVGLGELDGETLVAELPQNVRYMLEFAKAILWRPRVLIVDEITSALYRDNVATVSETLRRLRDQGTAIIFIGHRMGEILDLCDRVSVLRNGRITAGFDAATTTEEELLTEMIGRPLAEARAASAVDVVADGPRVLRLRDFPTPAQPGTIDLDVHAGRVVGIAGLQGQGQRELLRALFGLHGSAHFELDGEDVTVRSPHSAVRRGIAYVSGDRGPEGTFAIRSLGENLTVTSDLVLRRRIARPKAVLESLGVRFARVGQPISSLSGGNQQKIVLGRWLATSPRLLLADDATKGVDVAARRELHRLLVDLAAEGAAVVFASSDEEELVEVVGTDPGSVIHVVYRGAVVRTLRGDEISVERVIEASLPVTSGRTPQ